MTGNYEEDEEEEIWEKGKQQIEAAGRGRRFTSRGKLSLRGRGRVKFGNFAGKLLPGE